MVNDWTKVTTEELARLVAILDKALYASLGQGFDHVWLKVEGTDVLYSTKNPMPPELIAENKRLAPARAAWKELTELLETAE